MAELNNLSLLRNQITLSRTEIKNLRQQIISLKHKHHQEITGIKEILNRLQCSNCSESATTLNSNGDTPERNIESNITYQPIGIIETSFQNKRGVPRQPTILSNAQGTVSVDTSIFNNPEHALVGLEDFSHMWIIFHFHSNESSNTPAKVSPPRLQGEKRGVFSTRSPHRHCPIGLSLVKIVKIEGNKIHFLGVDMVNGTPVLDIKPYIPQYDYPSTLYEDTSMSSFVRPPTEGLSDVVDTVANLQVDNTGDRLSPHLTNPLCIDIGSPSRTSEYTVQDNNLLMTPLSPSADTPSSLDLLENFTARSQARSDTERGAPDGQERFTPPQSALINTARDGIRVAPWVLQPSQSYEVRFADEALFRLNELIGDRALAFKSTLETLLSEDPRSHYVRTRYPDHEYSCVLEDLSVSCVFDSSTSLCTIVTVRSAEEMQQS